MSKLFWISAVLTVLAVSETSLCATAAMTSLQGTWQSRYLERAKFGWVTRQFIFNGSHLTFIEKSYENRGDKQPYLIQTADGDWTARQNASNGAMQDIIFAVKKNVLLLTNATAKKLEWARKPCLPINVPIDAMTSDCSALTRLKNKKTIAFLSLIQLDNLLMDSGEFGNALVNPKYRQDTIKIYPLIKNH